MHQLGLNCTSESVGHSHHQFIITIIMVHHHYHQAEAHLRRVEQALVWSMATNTTCNTARGKQSTKSHHHHHQQQQQQQSCSTLYPLPLPQCACQHRPAGKC
jgi:hypothetical protein